MSNPSGAAVAAPSVLALLLCASAGAADVPLVLNYQGQLLDEMGEPIDGTVDLDIGVWRHATSPLPSDRLYFEQHLDVVVAGGVFHVQVGLCSDAPLPAACAGAPAGAFDPALFAAADRWVEVTVDGETLAPRQKLASVPYALLAESAVSAENLVGNESGITIEDDGSDDSHGLRWNLDTPHSVTAVIGGARGGENFFQEEWISGVTYNYNRGDDPTEHGFRKVIESGYIASATCNGGSLDGQSCSPSGPAQVTADACRAAGGVCNPDTSEAMEPNFNLYPVDFSFVPQNVEGSFEPGEELVFDDATHPAADDGARAVIVGQCADANGVAIGQPCRNAYLPGGVCVGGTWHGRSCAPAGPPSAQVTVLQCETAPSPGECVPGNRADSLCGEIATCQALVDGACGDSCSMLVRQGARGGYTNAGIISVPSHGLAGDSFRGLSSGATAQAAPTAAVTTVHRSEAHKWQPDTAQMSWSFRPDAAAPPAVRIGPNGEFCIGGNGKPCLREFDLQNGRARFGDDFVEPGSRSSILMTAHWQSQRDGSRLGSWSQLHLDGRLAPEGDGQEANDATGIDLDFGFDEDAGATNVEIGELYGFHLTPFLGDTGLADFGTWNGIRLAPPRGTNQARNHAALRIDDQRAKGTSTGDAIRIDAQTAHPSRGNLRFVGGDFDDGHIHLGLGHIWWDRGTDTLRVRDGAPTASDSCCAVVTGTGENGYGPAAWAQAGTTGTDACAAMGLACVDAFEPGGAQAGCGSSAGFRFAACK